MKPLVIGESGLPLGANLVACPSHKRVLALPANREIVADPEVTFAVESSFAARAVPAAVELQWQHPCARLPIEVRHIGDGTQVLALRNRIEGLEQGEDSFRVVPRIARDRLGCRQRVTRGAALRRGGGYEELVASIGCHLRDATRERIGQCREIRHRWRLGAVERTLDGGAPAAGFKIDEVGHVARSDTQSKRVTLQRGAVEELRVGPYRRHGRELVDDYLCRRLAADDREERYRRIVAAPLLAAGSPPSRLDKGLSVGRSVRAERNRPSSPV